MPPDRNATLAATQTAMLALITGRPAEGLALGAGALVVGDVRATAAARIGVYASMYRLRVAEALESQFPRLARWLGADTFAELAIAYVHDCPSRQPSLRYIGEWLPNWLVRRRPDSSMTRGLAHLEWVRTDVFDLADEATLTVESVRRWSHDRFGEFPLRLIAAHRLLVAPAGTAHLWDALGPEMLSVPADRPGVVETESLLVWRQGSAVYHRHIDERERAALAQVAEGTPFGVLCDSVLAGDADGGEEAAVQQTYAWMSTWLGDGLLAAVRW